MSDSVKLLGYNDRFSPGIPHDFFHLSIESLIFVHVLIAKFSYGLKLILFKVPFLLIIILSVKKSNVPNLIA